MDSNEQLLQGDSTDQGQIEQPKTVEINGEQVDIEELKKGYLRQSDYTKKTQEIAQMRKEIESMKSRNDDPDDVKAAKEFLDSYIKEAGLITRDKMQEEIEAIKRQQQDQIELNRIFESNPSLKQHEEAIKALAKTDNSALEDIIVKYNFLSSDKLKKAKERSIVGTSSKEGEKTLDIKSMTPEQWEKFKAEKGISKGGMFTSNNRSL